MYQQRKNILAFGVYVREARQARGFSRDELCEKLDLARDAPPGFIQRIELGSGWLPETQIICALAIALDVDGDELLARAGRVSDETKKIITRHPAEMITLLNATKRMSAQDILALAQQAESASSI